MRQAEIFFAARNREVQLGRRLVEGAEADRVSASARPNPTVAASTSKFNSRQGNYSGDLREKQMDSVFGVQQLFERGNKRELRMGIADFNISASRGESADIERQQRVALYSAYYDLVAAQERLKIAGETATAYLKTIDAVEKRLKAGDISASDVARIRVDALRGAEGADLRDRLGGGPRHAQRLLLAHEGGHGREARPQAQHVAGVAAAGAAAAPPRT